MANLPSAEIDVWPPGLGTPSDVPPLAEPSMISEIDLTTLTFAELEDLQAKIQTELKRRLALPEKEPIGTVKTHFANRNPATTGPLETMVNALELCDTKPEIDWTKHAPPDAPEDAVKEFVADMRTIEAMNDQMFQKIQRGHEELYAENRAGIEDIGERIKRAHQRLQRRCQNRD